MLITMHIIRTLGSLAKKSMKNAHYTQKKYGKLQNQKFRIYLCSTIFNDLVHTPSKVFHSHSLHVWRTLSKLLRR